MHRIVCATVAALILSAPVSAQSNLIVQAGVADGAVSYAQLGVTGRFRIASTVYGTAAVNAHATPGACSSSWPESFRCGYGGRSAEMGVAFVPLRSGRWFGGVAAAAGIWHRGTPPEDPTGLTWTAAIVAGARIRDRFWVEAAYRRRWIRDTGFEALFDEYPHSNAVTAGIGVSLW